MDTEQRQQQHSEFVGLLKLLSQTKGEMGCQRSECLYLISIYNILKQCFRELVFLRLSDSSMLTSHLQSIGRP